MPMSMEEMEKEINLLHDALTSRGVNSRKTADIFGREVSALPARACARSPCILLGSERACTRPTQFSRLGPPWGARRFL